MSNTLKIFEHPTPSNIKQTITTPPQKGYGYVYAMEVGDFVKIGCTTKPDKRFAQIRHGATGYGGVDVGRFAVSASVKNFYEWEANLHRKFQNLRKPNTELFSIPFEAAVRSLVREGEKEGISDEFEIWDSSANTPTHPNAIYKNRLASQIFVLLISMAYKRFVYTSISALRGIGDLEEEDVLFGLSYLRDSKVIDITECGNELLIKFL